MKNGALSFNLIIPHHEPKLHVISHLQHAKHSIPDESEIPEYVEKMLLLNNAIFLKSEFAKQSFRIIEDCYGKYGELLEDGNYLVKPHELFPALREIDNIIFELGSILDFFAREINISYKLGLSIKRVSFTLAVKECKKILPEEDITKTLCDFSESDLHQYFRAMRNRITHRLPFVIRGMNDQIFFPDNPNNDAAIPAIEKEIDFCDTCRKWLYGILTFVDRTSLIVFKNIARLETLDKKTRKKIGVDVDEYFKDLFNQVEEK